MQNASVRFIYLSCLSFSGESVVYMATKSATRALFLSSLSFGGKSIACRSTKGATRAPFEEADVQKQGNGLTSSAKGLSTSPSSSINMALQYGTGWCGDGLGGYAFGHMTAKMRFPCGCTPCRIQVIGGNSTTALNHLTEVLQSRCAPKLHAICAMQAGNLPRVKQARTPPDIVKPTTSPCIVACIPAQY